MSRKKKIITFAIIAGSIFGSVCIVIFAIFFAFSTVLAFSLLQIPENDELLTVSVSPDGDKTIEVYRVSTGGATVGFTIRAFITDENSKKQIYNGYPESNAEIEWINDDSVSINNRVLDLTKSQTFDWRWERSLIYTLFVKPFQKSH